MHAFAVADGRGLHALLCPAHQQPLQGAGKKLARKIQLSWVYCAAFLQLPLGKLLNNRRLEQLEQILPQAVLAIVGQCVAVEIPVGAQVIFQPFHGRSPAVQPLTVGKQRGRFGLEDPDHQIVFILKMVVEGVAANLGNLYNIADRDALQRHAQHQLFHTFGKQNLGFTGSRHRRSPPFCPLRQIANPTRGSAPE